MSVERFSGSLPPEAGEDLRALREVTTREAPGLAESVSKLRSREAARGEGNPVVTIATWSRRHPWPAAVAVAAVLVAVLSAVPISYERVTGQDVSLALTRTSDASRVQHIAAELERVLGARFVAVKNTQSSGGTLYTLDALVTGRSGADVRARADAFAKALVARGYGATAMVTPHREHVSGSVYAYARDVAVRVRTDGKSDTQVADEIRRQLADAGIESPEVTVSRKDGGQEITIATPRGAAAMAPGGPCAIDVELTQDGKPSPDAMLLRSLRRAPGGGPAFHMGFVGQDGRTAVVDVPNPGMLTDSALAEEINAQLHRAGVDQRVRVTNGKPEFVPRE